MTNAHCVLQAVPSVVEHNAELETTGRVAPGLRRLRHVRRGPRATLQIHCEARQVHLNNPPSPLDPREAGGGLSSPCFISFDFNSSTTFETFFLFCIFALERNFIIRVHMY